MFSWIYSTYNLPGTAVVFGQFVEQNFIKYVKINVVLNFGNTELLKLLIAVVEERQVISKIKF